MKIIRFFAYTLLTLVIVIGLFLFSARFADGPLEIVSGGSFTSGEQYSGEEPDWSFVRDKPTVEFQLMDPARSRTTWIVEHKGKIYIPSGYMTTTWGKIWKQWPIQAEKDGRAILRVDGKLYKRQLRRVKSGPEVGPIVELIAKKYAGAGAGDGGSDGAKLVESGYLWLFEMAPAE